MLQVSAVSYLNTKPLLYGVFAHELDQTLHLSLDTPAQCAHKLLHGQVDLGFVPVAIIPSLPQAHLVSRYGIAADGEVLTVAIFADCPLEELEVLYLDYQSRTSVALAQYLLREYWQVQPQLRPAHAGFEYQLGGRTGGVIIGDRTFGLHARYRYVYDLAQAWKNHTGLPFVFATWVSTRPLDPSFCQALDQAQATGLRRRAQVAQLFQSAYPQVDILNYYTRYIHYELDEAKMQGLQHFLGILQPPT